MALEELSIEGLNINDSSSFILRSLNFTPAQKRPEFVDNSDADGEALLREPHYTNAYFELEVRVAKRTTSDAALEALGELVDKVQACARIEGGAEVKWKPKSSSTTYIWYATLGELTEVPISNEDGAWTNRSPIAHIKLTCRPFGETEERTIKSATESGEEPVQTVYIPQVRGDGPASTRLILKDKSSQSRRFVEVGQDLVKSESPPKLLFKGIVDLTAVAGESSTKTSSYSTNVVKGTVRTVSQVFCTTGAIENIGAFKAKVRVQAGAESLFRISFASGDGQWTVLPWAELPNANEWRELPVGEVTFEEASQGTQTGEIRIEAKIASSTASAYIDYLELVPSKRLAYAATPFSVPRPTSYTAYSDFSTESGAITGDNLSIGGKWEGAGDAVDFSKNGEFAERSEKEDANENSGRYVFISGSKMTSQIVRVTVTAKQTFLNTARTGALARYASTENWLSAQLAYGVERVTIYLKKRVSGTTSLITSKLVTFSGALEVTYDVYLLASAGGQWAVWVGQGLNTPELLMSGFDSDLATGGTLAEGKAGAYDYYTATEVGPVRKISNVGVWTPAEVNVCESGKQVELNGQGAERENSGGTFWTPVVPCRGSTIYLDPAGDAEAINRLTLKMRRLNALETGNNTVTDKISTEVKVRERYLIPR